jgi:hypothetical protein
MLALANRASGVSGVLKKAAGAAAPKKTLQRPEVTVNTV